VSSQLLRRLLDLEDLGDVTVASFTNRKSLDEEDTQIVCDQLFSLVDALGRKKLVLNFANVPGLSSPALGTLVILHKKVGAAGGKLVLCGIDPKIHEVFVVTKLDKLFVIRGNEQEALQAF
jgi:anti-sigma B factor antagonist